MSREEIVSMLGELGVPCAHLAWRQGSAPGLPWAVTYMADDDHLAADGGRWESFPTMCIELYQAFSDEGLERSVEESLVERYGDYSKTESWVDEEDCVMCAYTFTDIEKGN